MEKYEWVSPKSDLYDQTTEVEIGAEEEREEEVEEEEELNDVLKALANQAIK